MNGRRNTVQRLHERLHERLTVEQLGGWADLGPSLFITFSERLP
ncbi:hypothetical protein EC9_12430 [Rosistilla ulvae]|uniref:Uncharacterized protein n=1 Tax=Rosistilla ulvae TaxID=1930277 RepID=A0A517LWS3_9BACT|nr:hypothetical protein EC9_12430 [Rosistilla ulvae]